MKKHVAIFFCLSALATLTPMTFAKSVPLEAPDPGRGIIGVTVNVVPPARMGSFSADAVYFVRVAEDADRFSAETFLPPTYSKGRNVYLLNAKPGRYVAIGCSFNPSVSNGFGPAGSAGEGVVAFAEADILTTEVEVRAGAVVFMGDIEVQSSTKIQEADGAQSHYLRMISPAGANQGFMARALSGHFIYIAGFKHIDRGPTAEAKFWGEATEKHFKKEAAWTSRIAGRSAAPVGASAGAIAAVAATGASRGATVTTLSEEEFLSSVCVNANAAKARANGQPEEAETIARMACKTVMAEWDAQGCKTTIDQDKCKKRLASLDASLRSSGSSMLFAGAQAGQTPICSAMIAMGSDPNAVISTGWTPLMIAAAEDKPETVKLLLEKGANPDAKNTDGKTPGMIAAEYAHPEIVEILSRAQAEAPSN